MFSESVLKDGVMMAVMMVAMMRCIMWISCLMVLKIVDL